MNYNFGFFAQTIKASSNLNQYELVSELLSCRIDLFDQIIDGGNANRYFHNKRNVPKAFLDHSRTQIGKQQIIEYFINYFGPRHVFETDYPIIFSKLEKCLNDDDQIEKAKKDELTRFRNNSSNNHEYLGHLYLISLLGGNTFTNESFEKSQSIIPTIEVKNKKLYINGEEIPVPERIIPPDDIQDDEQNYVYELMLAYAERKGVTEFTINTLPNEFSNHFNRHRSAYYSAETIRRRLRDFIPQEFDVLKDDIYDGIIDFVEQDFPDGLERLNQTFIHLTKIKTNKSKLEELQGWISIKERQGICHMLVNEGLIKWVK